MNVQLQCNLSNSSANTAATSFDSQLLSNNRVQSHYKKQLKFVSDSGVVYWQEKRVIDGVIFAMDGAIIGDETRSVHTDGFFVLLNAFHSSSV